MSEIGDLTLKQRLKSEIAPLPDIYHLGEIFESTLETQDSNSCSYNKTTRSNNGGKLLIKMHVDVVNRKKYWVTIVLVHKLKEENQSVNK